MPVSFVPDPVTMAKDPIIVFWWGWWATHNRPWCHSESCEAQWRKQSIPWRFWSVSEHYRTTDSDAEWISQSCGKKKEEGSQDKFMLNSMQSQREAKTEQLQALIAKDKMELVRLCTEYEAVHETEMEENELINHFRQKWGKEWKHKTFCSVTLFPDERPCYLRCFFFMKEILQFQLHLRTTFNTSKGLCLSLFLFAKGFFKPHDWMLMSPLHWLTTALTWRKKAQ